MNAETRLALVPYWAALALNLVILSVLWRFRTERGNRAFIGLIANSAFYVPCYIAELVSPTLDAKRFWDTLQWIPALFIAYFALRFALEYSQHPWERSVWFGLLLLLVTGIFTLLTLIDVNDTFVRSNARLLASEPFTVLTYDFPIGFYVVTAYLLGIATLAIVILLRRALHTKGVYRLQLLIISCGIFFPYLGGLFSVLGINLLPQRDTAPIGFAIGNAIFAVGILRFRLFQIAPIARERVFDTIDSAVLVLDSSLILADFNHAAVKLFGLSNAHRGQSIARLPHPWEQRLSPYLGNADSHQEITVEDRHYDLRVLLIRDREGQCGGYLLLLLNITAQVEARQALELRSKELEIAWNAAQEADRVKSQFLSSMSHELRTPLNAILNFTEFIRIGYFGTVNPQQADALDKVLMSSRHLLSLINDVLDMAKIQSNRITLFLEEGISVYAVCESVIATARSLLAEKASVVTLVEDIDDDLPTVVCDQRRITQVLLNLLSNAIKFTPHGNITLSAKRRGNELIFAVGDTGLGISPEDQVLIFEPFHQTEAGIRQGKGTGLGLPISRRLVEAHGGKLWLESAPNEGSMFYFSLPLQPQSGASTRSLTQ
ncbi:MAG: histidine kinase N-terminal 7TM domain-containing protein [Anaerolineae bacterium]